MNIKQFVEDSEREIQDEAMKYFAWVDASGIHGKERYTRYADFISEIIPTKLRELIGEVRREIIEWVSTNESCNKLDADMVERYVNSLLDEAGGK